MPLRARQRRDLRLARVSAVTPLDLSSLIPYLGGAWATGLIWVAIQLARGAWHDRLSARSALATARQGASYACVLSVCAIATAAYVHHLISHGVEGLVFVMLWASAIASPAIGSDRCGPEFEISGGNTSSDSGS
jgi:hypothetical protein